MTIDERLRRAADDVHALVATADLDRLHDDVRRAAAAPPRSPSPRRAMVALQVAAVVVLVIAGVGLALRVADRRSSSAKFSAVGSSINGAGGGSVGRTASADARALSSDSGKSSYMAPTTTGRVSDLYPAIERALRHALHVSVTPASPLGGGQRVEVRAPDLPAFTTRLVVQCAQRGSAPFTAALVDRWCDASTALVLKPDSSTSLAASVPVRSTIQVAGAGKIDCTTTTTPPPCLLLVVAAKPDDPDGRPVGSGSVSLHFRAR